jgi:hypothetical protein
MENNTDAVYGVKTIDQQDKSYFGLNHLFPIDNCRYQSIRDLDFYRDMYNGSNLIIYLTKHSNHSAFVNNIETHNTIGKFVFRLSSEDIDKINDTKLQIIKCDSVTDNNYKYTLSITVDRHIDDDKNEIIYFATLPSLSIDNVGN